MSSSSCSQYCVSPRVPVLHRVAYFHTPDFTSTSKGCSFKKIKKKKKTQPLLFPLIYQGKSQIYSVPDVPLLRATYGDIYFWREMFPPPQNDACLPFFSWRRCCVVLFTYTHKKTSKKKTADFSLSRNITTTSSTISITIETHTNPEINSPLPPNGCIL